MAAALAFSGTPQVFMPLTISLSGDSASTARQFVVTLPGGYTQTTNVTTDSSGAASLVVVPSEPGTLSASVLSSPTPSTIVSATPATVVS